MNNARNLIPLVLILCMSAAAPLLKGCAGTEERASTGQFIDDRTITAKIKTKLLQDPKTEGLKINVDTVKGRVPLSGFVASQEEKSRAEELARSVDGVISVDNNLAIK